MKEQPEFPALALLASRGLLAPDTWKCKRAQVSLKATIDVPMLGTIIEQNGDGLLEDSHMPVGWPLHIDGAVRQCCIHRSATLQELDDMLREYDMKRDSVEINHRAPQWSHNAVWNRKYMEPKTGYTLRQLWADSEPAIGRKSSPSSDVKDSDIRRAVAALADLPSSTLPDSPFILALGTPAAQNVPPQTGTLAQRALEEWERTLCENKAVAILEQMQAGRPALIQKDGGEMLIAIVLDRPLATRRRRCLLRSVWVNVMPERLLSVISGILAGGIPGFRIELCCCYHPLAWPLCVVLCFLGFASFSVAILIMTHKMSSCMLLS